MDASKSNPSQQEIKLHFLDYWRIIRVRKTVILVVFLIVLLSATAITLLLPKTYSSMARMEVNKEASDIDQLFGSNMPQQFDPFFIETEFQRIQSTSMLYPVIEGLGLQRSWAKKLNIPGELPIRQTYLMLLRQLNLSQTRNTSLIEVNVESRDPEEAAIIANKIAEVYKDSRLGQQVDAAERGIQTLITEREVQEEKIRAQQREVDKLSKDLQVSDLTAEGTSQTLTSGPAIIQRLELNRAESVQQLVSAKARLEMLQKMPEKELKNTITFLVPDQLLNSLLSSEALAEQRLVTMTQDKEMEHPDVLSVVALLEKVRSQISGQINGILRSLETEVASTETQVKKIEEEVERFKEKEREATEKFRPYFLAKRELESMQRMRDSLLAKITFEQIDSKIPL
jgi:polysaccharide biosynthesis transport protein